MMRVGMMREMGWQVDEGWIGGVTGREHVPVVVPMALSCIISDIKRDVGRKSKFFSHQPAFDAPVRCVYYTMYAYFTAAARRDFNMVLFTEAMSRRNTFVGGTCAPPSSLLL